MSLHSTKIIQPKIIQPMTTKMKQIVKNTKENFLHKKKVTTKPVTTIDELKVLDQRKDPEIPSLGDNHIYCWKIKSEEKNKCFICFIFFKKCYVIYTIIR